MSSFELENPTEDGYFSTYLNNGTVIQGQGNKTVPLDKNVTFEEEYSLFDDVYYPSIGVLLVIGVCGNGMVVFRTLVDKQLHSPTFAVIASVACADLMFLLFRIPIELLAMIFEGWVYGEAFCRILMYSLQVVAYSESYHLVFLALVRYYQLVHPLKALRNLTTKKTVVLSLALWSFLCVVLSPILVYAQVTSRSCGLHTTQRGYQAYFISYSVLCYFLPVTFLVIFHVAKARAVMKSGKFTHSRNKRQMSVAVVLILILFIVLLAPVHISNILMITETISFASQKDQAIFKIIARLMAYANSVINPIVYALFAERFRNSLLTALCSSSTTGTS